jgi:hypothetical protein
LKQLERSQEGGFVIIVLGPRRNRDQLGAIDDIDSIDLNSPEMRRLLTELFERDQIVSAFRPEIVPFHPRNPQQQSITGQAQDDQAKETQCVSSLPFVRYCSRS